MMTSIFLFSARPSVDEPSDLFRSIVYKGGHVIGYAMLSMSLWRAFEFRGNQRWLAWLLAVLYAISDEYHQSFVPGRHPSVFDVLVFDNAGALISLWLMSRFMKERQPISTGMVVETETLADHR